MLRHKSAIRPPHPWAGRARGWLVGLSLMFALSIGGVAHAARSILVVKSDSSEIYAGVEASLKARLEELCQVQSCGDPQLLSIEAGRIENGEVLNVQPDLVVTVGSRAARALQANPSAAPVLFTLLPSNDPAYAQERRLRPGDSIIFVDQPLERQLRLILQIRPVPSTVGVLLGPRGNETVDQLRHEADRLGLSIVTERVDAEADLGRSIKRLLHKSDVLLTLPDPSIYNRKTIFNILLSSYHGKVPVIGFSSAYVTAGALASVYTSPEDVGHHAAEIAAQYLISGARGLPAPDHPHYFSIAVNPQVARSLNIDIPDAIELAKRLREPQQ